VFVYAELIFLFVQVEHFHQYVETMETHYLNDRRRRGDFSNPFLKANRREAAKQEATDRIIHPMSHLTPPGQPTTLVAAPMIASQLQQTPFHTVATSPISYPIVPLPSVLPPSSIQTSPAPSINPFSSSGPVLQIAIHAGSIFVQDWYPIFCYFTFPSTIWRYTSHAIRKWIESETILPLELDITNWQHNKVCRYCHYLNSIRPVCCLAHI
jgi:nucleoporin p58/p45